ncbi:MAG: hypothetical protein ABSH38_02840 [Verrucomicrobiota bacterium]
MQRRQRPLVCFGFEAQFYVRKRLDNLGSEIIGRLELLMYPSFARTGLEFLQFSLRCFADLNVASLHRVIVVHDEDKDRLSSLNGPIELHFGYRNIAAVRHPAISPGINADVYIRLIDHFQRSGNARRIPRRKMLHANRVEACAQAGFDGLLSVLRQIDRRAADHGL